jgi:hypothetical protein
MFLYYTFIFLYTAFLTDSKLNYNFIFWFRLVPFCTQNRLSGAVLLANDLR